MGVYQLKVKLVVCEEKYEDMKKDLIARGIEIDDNADFILCENNRFTDTMIVKDKKTNGRVLLSIDEIVSIESFGHTIEVYTQDNTYLATERLYKTFSLLDPDIFLRISNSVIIAKNKVKQITPKLSMKFILTMSNGRVVDVTRSYYYIFKEHFGI